MRETVFCKHYRSMAEHSTCKVGVAYDKFKGMAFAVRPCYCDRYDEARPGCDLVSIPTMAERDEEDREINVRIANIGKARQAIVSACGGPWRKGKPSILGAITCPVCNGHLDYSQAGYNGHIHAKCKTKGCVSWVE